MSFTELISRQQAIEQGLKWFFTGVPCKQGHITKRNVSNADCRGCAGLRHKQWVAENKEKVQAYSRQWFEKNEVISKERNKNWYSKEENLVKKAEKVCIYYAKNQEVIREKIKIRRKNNPHIETAISAKKRATKLKRTPCWLTKKDILKIKKLYELASKKTKETGTPWHVDHIIPLRGKKVSGLHVPANLRVIPAMENLKKSNKWKIV